MPTESVDMDRDAAPPCTATVPNGVLPSRNCTVPPVGAGATAAVNRTACPYVELGRSVLTVVAVVVVASWLTAADVAPLKFASPL